MGANTITAAANDSAFQLSELRNVGTVTISGSSISLARTKIVAPTVTDPVLSLDGTGGLVSDVDIQGCTGDAVRIRNSSNSVKNSRISCGAVGVHVDGSALGNLVTSTVVASNIIAGQSLAGIQIATGSDLTDLDGNTISGTTAGARPTSAIALDGSMGDLCVRNNIFAHLGDGATTGYALSAGGALTQGATFAARCSDAIDGTWNNSVFAAAGNCTGPGCDSLPCKEPAGALGNLCTTTTNPDALRVREARFFEFSKVTLTKITSADTSTDPAFVGTGAAAWCVQSPAYIDHGAMLDQGINLGYGRVPPHGAGESHIGTAPDIGGLEAGAGVCVGYP
jgi:hypothetical protein